MTSRGPRTRPAGVAAGLASGLAAALAGGLVTWPARAPDRLHPAAALSDPAGAPSPDALVVAWATRSAVACAAWLVVVAVLTLVGAHTGHGAAAARRVLRWVAPVAVRRVVAATLGVGLVVGTGGGVAAAQPRYEASPGRVVATGPAALTGTTPRGTASVFPTLDDLDWPQAPAAGAARATVARPPGATTVVVRPGDTLWDLAAARLGPHASNRQVAQAWPAWWRANREVVGDDPDLLRPGQRLRPP